MGIPNIWECVETEAWCRGFDYDGYLDLHGSKYTNKGSPLDQEAWSLFVKMHEDFLERDNNKRGTN